MAAVDADVGLARALRTQLTTEKQQREAKAQAEWHFALLLIFVSLQKAGSRGKYRRQWPRKESWRQSVSAAQTFSQHQNSLSFAADVHCSARHVCNRSTFNGG